MNVNHFVRGKTVIKGRLVFGGGHPKFRWMPRFRRWGPNVSCFWFGAELVWLGEESRRNRHEIGRI